MSIVGQINGAYVGAANTVFGQSPFKVFDASLKAQRTEGYVEGGNRLSDTYIDNFIQAAQDPASVVAKQLGE